jgi:bacterioferritin (cytochrome b1)
MSTIEPLMGSPKLIAALKEVLMLEEDLFGWAHNEEHFFEHSEYCGLVKVFDAKVTEARDRRRPILNRIFQLGGMLDGVDTDPEASLESLLMRLRAIHAACQEAYEASEDPDDYVTQNLLTKNQKAIEKCIEKIVMKLAKKAIIGEQLWLFKLT